MPDSPGFTDFEQERTELMEGRRGLTGAALLAAGRHFENVAPSVELKTAAIEEEFFQLAPGALNAGFCARWRKSKALSHFVLGEALPLGEQQGFAVGGLQLVHELP